MWEWERKDPKNPQFCFTRSAFLKQIHICFLKFIVCSRCSGTCLSQTQNHGLTIECTVCIIDDRCVFCQKDTKMIHHIFFGCKFSTKIWEEVLKRCKIQRRPLIRQWKICWFTQKTCSKSRSSQIRRVALANTVYNIWTERNTCLFKGASLDTIRVLRNICFSIRYNFLPNCTDIDSLRDWC